MKLLFRVLNIIVVLDLGLVGEIFSQELPQAPDSTAQIQSSDRSFFDIQWSERKMIGVVLSTLVPGSGQTYLGHQTKGAVLTLTTLGSALVAVLSENNVSGRNERLDELKVQYGLSIRYVDADDLWRRMVETKGILDRNQRQRDLFIKVAAALWVVNIVDVLLFTEDEGEKTFGARMEESPILTVVPNSRNGMNLLISVHF